MRWYAPTLAGLGRGVVHDRRGSALPVRHERRALSKGLGFSREDRDTNIRRIAFVCHLPSRNGVVAISAAISPYRTTRDEARQLIGDFVESA